MENLPEILTKIPLFKGIPNNDLKNLLNKIRLNVKKYPKGATILIQGDPYKELYIAVNGTCYGEMIDFSGRVIKVEDLPSPCPLAPAVLFSDDNALPVSIIAKTGVECIVMTKHDVLTASLSDKVFLENYLRLVSGKFTFISKKLSFLAFKTIREKLAHYLFSLPEKNGIILIPDSLEGLSDLFGVSRPSLSRVLMQLEDEKIISRNNREVKVLDRDKLFT